MPWLETDPVKERKKLVVEWRSGDFTVTELSERHGVSRRTAYKWIDRSRPTLSSSSPPSGPYTSTSRPRA